METVFLILSGVILIAGVVYWLWSHIQLTQKKVQLLENAVFELRAMIPGGGTAGPPLPVPSPIISPVPAATKQYVDLADDDWEDTATVAEVPTISTPLEAVRNEEAVPQMFIQETTDAGVEDDLAPGGRIAVIPEPVEEDHEVPLTEDAFKAMLTGRALNASAYSTTSAALNASAYSTTVSDTPAPTVSGSAPVSSAPVPALDGMPLKELRRLGEQRGIIGAADMRKKEILAALRHQVLPITSSADKTLDLDTVEAQGIEDVVEPPAVSEQEAQILE